MKRAILMALLALASCKTPYLTARLSILGVRAMVPVADGVISQLDKAKKAECAKLGATGSNEYENCYAAMKKAVDGWTKSKPIVLAGIETGEAIVNAAEKTGDSGVTAWMDPVRRAVCLADRSLAWLPAKWQENVWVKTVRGFATGWAQCGSSAWWIPEQPKLMLARLKRAVGRI